jgi:ADP-heptose:LPS heptosyltransferase
LIVRLSAIGDAIQTLPVACALRERRPKAVIAWAAEPRAAALLEGHPAIDHVVCVPRGFLKSPRVVWDIRRRLRALHCEVAIDVQSLTKSGILSWLSGAKRRIGLARPMGRELSPWLNNEFVLPTAVRLVDQYLELLRPLGIDRPAACFNLPEAGEDREAATRVLHQVGLLSGFAMINVGAGSRSRLWPTERFAAVARHLLARWSLPSLVVWAGREEQRRAEEVVAGSQGAARLAPATSLRELASITRRAKVFVSSETGPLHLAAAVGTPCVGLYGPWPADRNGPYGPQHVAIQKMRFEGSTRQRRQAPPIYMEAIDVASVCEACDRVLEPVARRDAG